MEPVPYSPFQGSAPRRERAIRPGFKPLEARLRKRCNVRAPDLSPLGWAPADIPARTAISPNKRFHLQLQLTTGVVVGLRVMAAKRLRAFRILVSTFRELHSTALRAVNEDG